jgi:acyl phosphate:glycerol-3-phosphate acyltransferase
MPTLLLSAAVGYLLGSIPFGYLLVRAIRGADIRQSGSGNIGATNVARTSPLLGIATLLLDATKGFLAVVVAILLSRGEIVSWAEVHSSPSSSFPPIVYWHCLIAALFAVLGHVFPVWLKFKGGKGVATALGSFAMLAPKTIVVVVGIFLGVVLIFRYVSLASVIAVACFPVLAWLLRDYEETPLALGIMALTSLVILLKHHENIRRLLAGKENRFQVGRG